MRLYAVGDIHGHLDKLESAHALIEADRRARDDDTAPVIHLGDYIDRGPDSAGVVDYLVRGLAAGRPWIMLKGNHDEIFAQFLDGSDGDPAVIGWLSGNMGGAETLASYGVRMAGRRLATVQRDARAAVPAAHRAFLAELALADERGSLLFVHAGVRPGRSLAEQDPHDLVWIREGFLDSAADFGWLVVHGHTPVPVPMHCGNRIALDGGAAFGRPLIPAVFEGTAAWLLTPEGREPLTPGP